MTRGITSILIFIRTINSIGSQGKDEKADKPYERYNGYYYIKYTTLLEKKDEIEQILLRLRDSER